MSNLDKLIEWMKEELKAENDLSDTSIGYRMALRDCVVKAKQLQKEEPKTYTQEEMDKAIEQAWIWSTKYARILTHLKQHGICSNTQSKD